MNPSLSHKYSSKAADLVNENITRLTTTLDRLGRQLAAEADGSSALPSFGPAVAQQLDRASHHLTNIQGEAIVEKAKDQMTRHPTALTIAGAVTGAAFVQLAILVLRREQKSQTSDARMDSEVPISIMSDAL